MGKCKPLKFVYSNAASLSINPVCFETKVISSAICHLLVFFCGAGEVEKNSLIALPGKGRHGGLVPSKVMCPNPGGLLRSFVAAAQGQVC